MGITRVAGEPIAHKWANALIRDAEPNETFDVLIDPVTYGLPSIPRLSARWMLRALKAKQGGLWVGGDLYLYGDRLTFEANRLNSSVQTGTLSFELLLKDITSVTRRFGLVTGIVDIVHGGHRTAVRCYGARQFAELLQVTILAATGRHTEV